LASTVALKRVQPIAGRDLQILDPNRSVDLIEPAPSTRRDSRRYTPRLAGQVQLLRLCVSEGLDHYK
jgi:hypothetical protein